MVAVPMLPHAEFGRNDHREYALKFMIKLQNIPEKWIFEDDFLQVIVFIPSDDSRAPNSTRTIPTS